MKTFQVVFKHSKTEYIEYLEHRNIKYLINDYVFIKYIDKCKKLYKILYFYEEYFNSECYINHTLKQTNLYYSDIISIKKATRSDMVAWRIEYGVGEDEF